MRFKRLWLPCAALFLVGSVTAGLRTNTSRLGHGGGLSDLTGSGTVSDPSGATIFVDSVSGSDASNGRTSASAKQTLAGVLAMSPTSGDVIGLKRGSTWREGLYDLPDGARVVNYSSSGALPQIRSDDVATGWSATSGRTNVWELAWTRDVSSGSDHSGTDPIRAWEDDAQLKVADSIANCESTAGSSYYDETGHVLYYHPTDNADPSTHTVEATKRPEGIYERNNAVTVSGLRLGRSWAHFGVLSTGAGSTVSNVLLEGGGIHHSVMGAGSITDAALVDFPSTGGPSNSFVFYQGSAAGLSATATRVFNIGTLATRSLNNGFFWHTSGGDEWESITLDQCAGQYCDGFVNGGSLSTTVTNFYLKNCVTGGAITSATNVVRRAVINGGTGRAGQFHILYDSGPTDATTKSWLIEDSVLYLPDFADRIGIDIDSRTGALTIRNCIIYTNGFVAISAASNGSPLSVTIENCIIIGADGTDLRMIRASDADVTYSGDHNLFVRLGDGGIYEPTFSWHNGYTGGLAAWQSASGSDAHSAFMYAAQFATFFSGDITAGDFRINASNVVKSAAGTNYTGTFPDGVAITTAGPQTHWNWNTRAVVSGPPTVWPTMPTTAAEGETYVLAPATWNFYP